MNLSRGDVYDSIWSPYLVNMVTTQETVVSMLGSVAYPAYSTDEEPRHNNNVIFTAIIQASDSPIDRALDIGFIGPRFKPRDGPLFSIPVLLATADRMGVSGLDLCQHFSVR